MPLIRISACCVCYMEISQSLSTRCAEWDSKYWKCSQKVRPHESRYRMGGLPLYSRRVFNQRTATINKGRNIQINVHLIHLDPVIRSTRVINFTFPNISPISNYNNHIPIRQLIQGISEYNWQFITKYLKRDKWHDASISFKMKWKTN